MKRMRLWPMLLAAAFCGAGLALAGDEEPGRGVARISLINGDVSVRRGDSGDWVAAAVNSPLVVPDSVYTGEGSRAEIQLDYANMIRLAGNTEVRFSELEHRRYQIQLARGTVTFSVLRDSDADVDLSTPNVSVRPVSKGSYRVSVHPDGTTEITVRSGEAEIFTPRGVERLREGRAMTVRGTAADPEFRILAASARDDWDRWNEARDKELRRSKAYRYVSRDIYGVEDLDAYGTWIYVPPYGWVWSPRVVAGWAPYRFGRWSWIDWYGWTWISYDPWGWAPFHYGRWFFHRPYGWCWWPGGLYVRHYWRPALVAFFGWGGGHGFHFGVGFGFGRIGWVPLAPYEVYYPWYGRHYYRGYRHANYIDNSVNIVKNINITNIYRNAAIDNAITAVDGAEFGRAHVRNTFRSTDLDLRRTNLVRGQVPIAPGRESLRLADREVRAEVISRGSPRGQFFSRRNVQAPDRVPFDEQRRGMERVAQRAAEQLGSPRFAQSSGRTAARAPGAGESPRAASSGTSGWRRFGEPARPRETGQMPGRYSVEPSPRSSQGTVSGRWRRFGEVQQAPAGSAERSVGSVPSSFERPGRTESPRVTGSGSSGWRRFGEPTPAVRDAPASRPSRSGEEAGSSGWRSFEWGTSGSTRDARSRFPERGSGDEPAAAGRIFGSPRSSGRFESGRSQSPRYERPSARESIRISPPMVRERSAPRFEPRSPSTSQPRGSLGGFSGSRGSPRSPGGIGLSRSGGSRSGGGAPTMSPRGGSSTSRGATSGRGSARASGRGR